jgi:hypothetical protein
VSGSVLLCSASVAGTGIVELGIFVRVAVLLGQWGSFGALIVGAGGDVGFGGLAK